MTYTRALLGLILCITLKAQSGSGQSAAMLQAMDADADRFGRISRQIWENPELGFSEVKSSALLRDALKAEGFRIADGVAGMPTAFIAEYGSGKPVIAILGEYDALPGLSQDAVPQKKAVVEGGPGHGCGHNLFGAASAMAAIYTKREMEKRGLKGTLRFYGTPAEEGGGGKLYMLRAGLFKDVDAVLVWHPANENAADLQTWLANISAKVRFKGTAAHAAANPEYGRSALDAIEVMAHAVNLLREHVPQETRMHYIITKGGSAANIVPDVAEVSIIVRHPDQAALAGIWERVLSCAQAGAVATGTQMEFEVTASYSNVVPNPVLVSLLDRSLHTVGGVRYTPEETVFAEQLRASVGGKLPPLEIAAQVLDPVKSGTFASTDVGDVSWNVPTGHMLAATMPPGVPFHSWQSTASSGSSIGRKGMLVAAKTLALSAVELFSNPKLVAEAKAGFDKQMQGLKYESLLPSGAKPQPR